MLTSESESKVPITFTFIPSDNIKASSVQICGSFNNWQVRHPLTYDPLYNKWSVTLRIKKGTHFYKYIVDGEWVISRGEKTITDQNGFINNFISI